MIFYVAHGAAGACGPGCSEWIAAEGTVQWDTHKRLIAILDRQGRAQASASSSIAWGESNLNVATSLGRILRGRGIDTTAGSTEVEACKDKPEADCFALKRPGGPLEAKMNVPDPPCDIACVLMLAGGVHRSLPAGHQGDPERHGPSTTGWRPTSPRRHREGLDARSTANSSASICATWASKPSCSTSSTGIPNPIAKPNCRHPNGSGCGSSPPPSL